MAIGLLGVLSTAFLGFIAYRLSTTNQQYAARRAIGDLHSEMARMRSEYPAIKSVCACWDDDHRIRMYDGGDSAAQDLFVRYEAHMDIGLEFCNTALGAWARGVIHASDFTRQYRPLVHLFIGENWPFIRYCLDGPYISGFLRDEISAREAAGQ